VRKEIEAFLATKKMTQTDFLVECGKVNSNSLRNFMSLKGAWNNTANGSYYGALVFFWDQQNQQNTVNKKENVETVDDQSSSSTLDGLTVPDLKEACRNANLQVGGTKAVLIKRLREHQGSTTLTVGKKRSASSSATKPKKQKVTKKPRKQKKAWHFVG
jgi:hypothetical protein